MISSILKINNISFYLFGLGVILSPIINILPFGINITISDCLFFAGIYILIVKYFVTSSSKKIYCPKQINIAFGFIFFGYMLASFFVQDVGGFYFGIVQYLFVIVILPWIMFIVIDSKEKLIKIIHFYLFGVFIINLLNLGLYFELIAGKKLIGLFRFAGVLENPNVLAKFQITAIMSYIVVLLKWKVNIIKKVLIISNIIISLFLIATTGSFGGILFFIISLILMIFLHFLFYRSGRVIIVVGLTVCLLTGIMLRKLPNEFEENAFVPAAFTKRVLIAKNISQMGSASDKLAQIVYGYIFFTEHPVIGVGLENYKYYNKPAIKKYYKPMSAHSFYIAIATEGGIFTMIGFILFFGIIFSRILFLEDRNLKFFFMVMFFTFLSNIIIANNIYPRHLWFPLIFVFGKADTKRIE